MANRSANIFDVHASRSMGATLYGAVAASVSIVAILGLAEQTGTIAHLIVLAVTVAATAVGAERGVFNL